MNERNIDPNDLKNVMGKIDERYKYNNQEDANEFISNFLNNLLEETSDKNKFVDKNNNIMDKLEKEAYEKFYNKFYKKKGKSLLLNLFYGNLITVKYCKNCGLKSTIKFSAYNMLELPIYELSKNNNRTSLDIDKILDSYFSDSIFNQKCKSCNRMVYMKNYLYNIPQYLIISFARTVNGDEYIGDEIIYSNKLNLNKYLYDNKNNNNYSNYFLECVIEHTGNAKSGHYTCLCQISNNWYYFSDSHEPEKKSSFQSKNAIILLYKSQQTF